MKPQVFISKLEFNDNTVMDLDSSDIVIFTGANNAGKSQVLRDIDNKMSRDSNKTIVLRSLQFIYAGDINEIEESFKKKEGGYQIA